ncbi:hypothetical protein LTR62_003076 [Meristemomyces frigidus]|uniref:Ribosomal RNA-processing protein 7 n=1 Tax=Meristemomyces frigidus TaxID=1508187 RepID=A0AAN7YPY4_9PEZI|nr:hypothetical protein LTR62_003076 [Meristemomyces frigidus]
MVPMPVPKSSIPATINDFAVLPVQLPPIPSYPVETTHYLYLRLNAPKLPTEDTPRELFLVNLPIDATSVHIRTLFAQQLGGPRVEKVEFEGTRISKGITAPATQSRNKKRKRSSTQEDGEAALGEEVGQLPELWDRGLHRSGGTAVVTFVDKASADLAMREAKRAIKEKRKTVWMAPTAEPPLGSARYRVHHTLRYPDPALLQESVDTFITAFAAQETARAQALSQSRSVPDADGFITVTRGARAKPSDRAEEVEDETLSKRRKKERKKVGEDFYRFQMRERRKEEQLGLVRGFEEDARKLEELRRRRGKVRVE